MCVANFSQFHETVEYLLITFLTVITDQAVGKTTPRGLLILHRKTN